MYVECISKKGIYKECMAQNLMALNKIIKTDLIKYQKKLDRIVRVVQPSKQIHASTSGDKSFGYK